MKIAMFTNTYAPHVGGVAKSIQSLEAGCRARGHEVRVVAPEFPDTHTTAETLRVPAIQNFNGSDFCVRLPSPGLIRDFMADFAPDIVHSHHPFLLGDAALREASKMHVPIVFTHHTLYERYTHYVPLDSDGLKRAAIQMATEYCNLCDAVIAPSDSIARLLVHREVVTPIEVIPTGIDTVAFGRGRNGRFRKSHGIPEDVPVVGHVGRLAREKNLPFLAEAVAGFLATHPTAVFLLVGDGDCLPEILEILSAFSDRVIHPGRLTGDELTDAYAAIDCFAFTSQTETQGMVLAEAMAASTPVVALDGPGVREILANGENGILLPATATAAEFATALATLVDDHEHCLKCANRARETAMEYDTVPCVDRVLHLYEALVAGYAQNSSVELAGWDRVLAVMEIEWGLLAAKFSAAVAVVVETPATEAVID